MLGLSFGFGFKARYFPITYNRINIPICIIKYFLFRIELHFELGMQGSFMMSEMMIKFKD